MSAFLLTNVISGPRIKSWLLATAPRFLHPHWARLEASPLGYRLARGAFWSIAGAVISRGLGLLASILVARMLGRVGFGELGIIQTTVGMFGTFAGFGLGVTATKHVAEFRGKDPARAGRIIAISNLVSWLAGGTMAALLLALAPWLASRTLAAPHLSGLLRLGSLLLLFGAINGAQTGALAGFEAFRRIAKINLAVGLATFPLMVGGVWGWGLEGAVTGLVLSQGFTCVLNHYALHAEAAHAGVPLSHSRSTYEWRILWNFSVPAVASGFMVGPVYWFCSAMLVNRPDGYAQMGIFNAANQWFSALLFLPGVLGQAALPVLSERLGDNDRVRSAKVLKSYIKLNAVVVGPLVIIGSLLSPWIMSAYGPGFGGAWQTLSLVLLTAGLLALQTPVGQVIAASGRMWLATLMNTGWAACFIGLTWALLPWGATGLASARLGAYAVHAIWTFAFAWGLLRRSRQ